jgi:hypothetical protein
VLVFPSFALEAGKPDSVLPAVSVPADARSVVRLMPLPDSAAVVGVSVALLVIVSVPGLAPAVLGVNPTVTVQDPSTARVEQLLVSL